MKRTISWSGNPGLHRMGKLSSSNSNIHHSLLLTVAMMWQLLDLPEMMDLNMELCSNKPVFSKFLLVWVFI